jgi:hypothetical protein
VQTDDIGRYELGSLIARLPLYNGNTYIFLKLTGYSTNRMGGGGALPLNAVRELPWVVSGEIEFIGVKHQ